MKYLFIITSGSVLSLVGISALTLDYALDYAPFELLAVRALLALALIVLFIRKYCSQTSGVNSWQGFVTYFLNFISILFLSSFLNLSFEYSIYNHIDPAYKYQLEEKEFQKVYEHRMKRGLPLNHRISDEQIDIKYGLGGLIEMNLPVYVFNFITVLLLYLVAILFNHMRNEKGLYSQ